MQTSPQVAPEEEEEDTQPMPEAEKAKDPHRDAAIKILINGTWFKGKVEDIEVGVKTGTVHYRIRYEDDDLDIIPWTS